MKRSTKLALSLVLAAGFTGSAMAQDNFPDVPANHWAYEALARMKKDGLLVGYPDGLYRGGRPASRYELAVAMHAVYTNLKNVTDGLDAQIQALKGAGSGNFATQADVAALKDAIAALQADLAAMKGYGDDIAALKRASETFDKELKSLGVDVEAMKKDLGDLAGRVKALENKKPSIEVTGDVNVLMLASNSSGDLRGLSQDGRVLGEGADGGTVGLTDSFSLLHEAAFTFTGTNTSGVKWTGTAVVGNMISDGTQGDSLGGQSTLAAGRYTDGVSEDIYIQNLEAMFGAEAFGLGFDFTLGRVQHKVSPYMFQRIDNSSYYSNERWDNGKYAFDGGIVGFKAFGAKFTAFGGRNSQRYSVNGIDLNQVVLGNNRVAGNPTGNLNSSDETLGLTGVPVNNNTVDRSLGLQLAFPLTKVGNLNLAYLWLDSDSAPGTTFLNTAGANRVEVYGGDADFTFGRIKLSGGFHQSSINDGTEALVKNDENAWNGKLAFTGNKFGVWGGYSEVGGNYVAPGDWGRVGILRNLAGVRGWDFGGNLNISDALVLSGTGKILSGFDHGSDIAISPFDGQSEIQTWSVRADYKLNPNLSVFGSYEDSRYSDLLVGPGGTAQYRYSTLGLGYGLSSNAKLNLSYQYSDVKNEAFLGGAFGDRYKGGLLTTQLTVKF